MLPVELQERIVHMKERAELSDIPSLTWDKVQFKKFSHDSRTHIRALYRTCGIECPMTEREWAATLNFDKRIHGWVDTRGRKCVSISLYADDCGRTDHDSTNFRAWVKQFADVRPELVERYYNKNTNDKNLLTLFLHRNLIYIIRLPL